MNENAKAWIRALRSGEYRQTQYYLRRRVPYTEDVRHCCLGVACDVVDPKAWIADAEPPGEAWGEIHESVMLPASVADWLGIRQSARVLGDRTTTAIMLPGGSTLDGLNDHGRTFEQIADLLEKYEKEVFE